jgi:hypothetical protein
MKMKRAILLLTAAMFCMAMTFPSMAATKISSITLEINSNISAGETGSDVDVSTSSGRFSVDDVEVTNEPKNGWEENDKPKIKITLAAEDGYYFPTGMSKSDVDISGDDGTVTSISRKSNDSCLVYVTLAALDDEDGDDAYDLDVDDLEWDDGDGTASWNEPDDAKKYEVRLYRGGSTVTSILTTSNTYYHFASYFTKSGDYTFKVRAVYSSSHKGSWVESDTLTVTASEAREIRENGSTDNSSSSSSSSDSGPGNTQSTGAWLQDSIGYWYCNADRSYPVNQWQYINNYWYYFNESGYMVTGWVYWNEKWYYCSDSGAMLASTTTPDGYYVGADGAWIQ